MPVRLSTTISKISLLANLTNQMLVTEFYEYRNLFLQLSWIKKYELDNYYKF